MKLQELIRRFRVATRDTAEPYLFPDADIRDWLNDAQEQACIRARLIRDDSTAEVTQIPLTVGTHTYTLHESLYEIVSINLVKASGEDPQPLTLKSLEWLNYNWPDWRYSVRPTEHVIQDDTSIRVIGTFMAGDRIDIEAYRLPLDAMISSSSEPEIHRVHHLHLIDWALHKAYSIPDTETFDADRAQLGEAAFTAYFGPLPDADMRRITREDTEHSNYSILP